MGRWRVVVSSRQLASLLWQFGEPDLAEAALDLSAGEASAVGVRAMDVYDSGQGQDLWPNGAPSNRDLLLSAVERLEGRMRPCARDLPVGPEDLPAHLMVRPGEFSPESEQALAFFRDSQAQRAEAWERARALLNGVDVETGRLVSQAIAVYCGSGYPEPSDRDRQARVVREFGRDRGPELVRLVEAALDDIDSIPTVHQDNGRVVPGPTAAEQMARRHPWLDPDALSKLQHAYDWWNR